MRACLLHLPSSSPSPLLVSPAAWVAGWQCVCVYCCFRVCISSRDMRGRRSRTKRQSENNTEHTHTRSLTLPDRSLNRHAYRHIPTGNRFHVHLCHCLVAMLDRSPLHGCSPPVVLPVVSDKLQDNSFALLHPALPHPPCSCAVPIDSRASASASAPAAASAPTPPLLQRNASRACIRCVCVCETQMCGAMSASLLSLLPYFALSAFSTFSLTQPPSLNPLLESLLLSSR